ncbi:MAG: L,D-transpeptidase [Proteobacteria bacterium]|nr:L,D-transpeptidase [Pseudomonadota bacterium]
MPAKKNAKRKTSRKRKKRTSFLTHIKTFVISLALGALAAVGFWRCVEEGGEPLFEQLDTEEIKAPTRVVRMKKNRAPDPTLLQEQKLLEAEMPSKKQATDIPSEKETELASKEDAAPEPPLAESEEELKERFPMYAVAFHFHTQVRLKPNLDSRVIGYARRGMTFRVGEQLSKKGCKKGWHEVAPGDLFICEGRGVIVSPEPVSFAPSPSPPNLDAPMPYEYTYVTADNTPQYWRIPTLDESKDVLDLFDRIAAKENEHHDKSGLASVLAKAADLGAKADGGSLDSKSTDSQPVKTAATKDPVVSTTDGGTIDPYALPRFVHLRMNRGYYVSMDSGLTDKRKTYKSTVRGRYLPSDKLAPAKPSTFEGLLLGRTVSLPRVFVVGGGVKLLQQKEKGGPLQTHDKLARLTNLPFLGEMKRRRRRYVQIDEDLFLLSRVAAVAKKIDPPDDLKPNERWIHIDLSEQTLVAYEGEDPVFATLVSSGRKGFETPPGSFRIYSKHVSITMDDPEAGEEAYSIEDVPWTQYFEDSYALHGAFWHNRFGRVRSHGCINLSPADAHRLFFWTGPHLPDGLHGIVATRENPGTRVIIQD